MPPGMNVKAGKFSEMVYPLRLLLLEQITSERPFYFENLFVICL